VRNKLGGGGDGRVSVLTDINFVICKISASEILRNSGTVCVGLYCRKLECLMEDECGSLEQVAALAEFEIGAITIFAWRD
jgi:hypothetical protein